MALARANRVKKLAGDPTDQQMETMMDLDDILDDADQKVYDYTKTDAADWVEDDTHGYDWARDAAEYFAATRLSEEFHDINNKSDVYRKAAMENLKTLRQIGYGVRDGDNPSFVSATSRYTAAQLQAGKTRYRSKNFFGGEYD